MRLCAGDEVNVYPGFQSTHPLRGATSLRWPKKGTLTISIHAPLAGCDDFLKNVFTGNWISIHAPLAGCDVTMPLTVPKHLHFNPRTPCGVRRHCRPRALCGRRISIHAPLAGCDAALRDKASEFFISIHAPLAGCDDRVYSYIRQENEFQSTHPLRGATEFTYYTTAENEFQSTHPLRGATLASVLREHFF